MEHENTYKLEVTDLVFEQLAAQRWAQGRAERGLSDGDGFVGDATREFSQEMLDGGNYLSVMFAQGRIDEQTAHRARVLLHDLFTMAQTSSMGTVTGIHERAG